MIGDNVRIIRSLPGLRHLGIARGVLVAALAMLSVSACASLHKFNSAPEHDPFESFNRKMFAFNDSLDQHVFLPVATFYRDNVPARARKGMHNFLANLDMPITIGNDLLQFDLVRASEATARFGLNSTLGIGGLMDLATEAKIPNDTADFGQTLGIYGLGAGPYLVLPFYGPTTPRDFTGDIGDHYLDPITYSHLRDKNYWQVGRAMLGLIDERERNIDNLKSVRESSVDYYATIRSLYRQDRDAKVHKGKPDLDDLENH
jgi:phospholipid-binding lipoprotein MlaA